MQSCTRKWLCCWRWMTSGLDLILMVFWLMPVVKYLWEALTTSENARNHHSLSSYGDVISARRQIMDEIRLLVEANPHFRKKLENPQIENSRLRRLINQRWSLSCSVFLWYLAVAFVVLLSVPFFCVSSYSPCPIFKKHIWIDSVFSILKYIFNSFMCFDLMNDAISFKHTAWTGSIYNVCILSQNLKFKLSFLTISVLVNPRSKTHW